MDTLDNIATRSARDRVIDLIGMGDTYPLTDLNVVADQLKVAYGRTAKIPIEHAQAGVVYQLCDPAGISLGDAFKAEGEDATLFIETPEVNKDVSYRILAIKQSPPGSSLPAQTPYFLNERALVKVGIDTTLEISFTKEQNLPLLDPTRLVPHASDPRIVVYGRSVNVQVAKTQEGVEYSLVLDGHELEKSITGDLGDIVLKTGPVFEDAVIQVRATKNFLASENREPEITLLDAKLYLKVMANPTLVVSVEPASIIDHQQHATINIANTQPNAKYQVYTRAIADADFVRSVINEDEVVRVAVAENPDVQVRKPERLEVWHVPEGYAPLGDAPVSGTGGKIKITTNTMTEDSLVIVQVIKQHLNEPDVSNTIASSIRIAQVAAILVRPNPAQALRLRVPVSAKKTGDFMQVSDGQPGIFYHFKPLPKGNEFPLPAYFHKRDVQNNAQNKGVGQLGVEVDFVIVEDPLIAVTEPATTLPLPPTIGITPVATGSKLAIRAVKAQTRVEVAMAHNALIAAMAEIHAELEVIDYGDPANIVIPASNKLDRYQVMLLGTPVQSALSGNTKKLTVLSDPLNADAVFEIVVSRLADNDPLVERVLQVPVFVRPDTRLSVSAKRDRVPKGSTTAIIVQRSQQNVAYQLMSGEKAIGQALPGTGTDIGLPTGPIEVDSLFSLIATRMDKTDIAVALTAQVSVRFKIDTEIAVMFKASLPPLDPGNLDPQPLDPRLVGYGSSVEVQLDSTQGGVSYSLLVDGQKRGEAVTGNEGSIVLSTGEMFEDAVIQVKAGKNAPIDKNTQPETAMLDAILYLNVMASTELAVSVEPAPIIEYGQDAIIRLTDPQLGVEYKAFVRNIADRDFVHGATDADVATVAVAGKDDVKVIKPARSEHWQTPEGYTPLSDEFIAATDSKVEFKLTSLLDDSLVIVQAVKNHFVDPNNPESTVIASSIGLAQAAAVLVRPDPGRALKLSVPVSGAKSGDSLEVSDGQPGVFYYFQAEPDGPAFPLPAYFHQRDLQDTRQNKGVDQLGIEIDFVVVDGAATKDSDSSDPTDPATSLPALPRINITPVVIGTVLSIRARKAQTAIEAKLSKNALIAAVPDIHADPAVIDYAAPANIVIPASNKLDRYQLTGIGMPEQSALNGNGNELTIASEALNTDAVFDVEVTRIEDEGLQLKRVLQIPVFVRPDTSLVVTAKQDTVAKDSATEIIVQGSQQGVTYQLMSGETAIGPTMQGTGADIALATGPIAADSVFTLIATRIDKPDIAAELKAQPGVKVEVNV